MAFVNTVDKYGDEVTVGMFIDGSIPEFCDDKVTTIKKFALNGCAVSVVDTPWVTSVGYKAFYATPNLTAVILRSYNGMAVATGGSLFGGYGSAYNNKQCYIYVPSALIEEYKAATNWSTYADYMRALEDYTVDGTVDGELDENKI